MIICYIWHTDIFEAFLPITARSGEKMGVFAWGAGLAAQTFFTVLHQLTTTRLVFVLLSAGF